MNNKMQKKHNIFEIENLGPKIFFIYFKGVKLCKKFFTHFYTFS